MNDAICFQSQVVSLRQQFLDRLPVGVAAELVEAAGNFAQVVKAGLKLALQVLDAKRGLAFDNLDVFAAEGFAPGEAEQLREERLAVLLSATGVRYYSRPSFAARAEAGEEVIGMADVIALSSRSLVVAIERERQPFPSADQQIMAEALSFLKRPLEQAVKTPLSGVNRGPLVHNLAAAGLPLGRVDPLPTFEQMERLLIEEALVRSGGKKAKAAAALGVTREGLRKMMLRMEIGTNVPRARKAARPAAPLPLQETYAGLV